MLLHYLAFSAKAESLGLGPSPSACMVKGQCTPWKERRTWPFVEAHVYILWVADSTAPCRPHSSFVPYFAHKIVVQAYPHSAKQSAIGQYSVILLCSHISSSTSLNRQVRLFVKPLNPKNLLHDPSFHVTFHCVIHLILHCWGNILYPELYTRKTGKRRLIILNPKPRYQNKRIACPSVLRRVLIKSQTSGSEFKVEGSSQKLKGTFL